MVPIQTIEMFLDLLGRGVVAIARSLVAADLWPVIVLAVGLLLLIVVIPLVSQSLRLHRLSHQLRELSNIVQRQEQTIRATERLAKRGSSSAGPTGVSIPRYC